jgi:hypothetical protein
MIWRTLFYPFAVVFSLLSVLFAMLLTSWWSPLLRKADNNLPGWLYWSQTFDAALPPGYWPAVCWLYRNPCYEVDMLLGVDFDPNAWTVRKWVNTPTLIVFFATGPAFNLYVESRFGMVKFGWKAWNFFDATTARFTVVPRDWPMRAPVCFSLTPFKRLPQ